MLSRFLLDVENIAKKFKQNFKNLNLMLPMRVYVLKQYRSNVAHVCSRCGEPIRLGDMVVSNGKRRYHYSCYMQTLH
jgi:formylmethanofuran dehydrogenase subunit E